MLDELTDILAEVDLFQGLPREGLRQLAKQSLLRSYPAGAFLTHQGDAAMSMHVILSGRVRVERHHPGMTDSLMMLERGPYEIVGGVGVLDGDPRPDSAVAVDETVTLEIGAAPLALLALQHPEVSGTLLRSFSRRMHRIEDLLAELRGVRETEAAG